MFSNILNFFTLSNSSQTIDVGCKVEYVSFNRKVRGFVRTINGTKAKIVSRQSQHSDIIRWVEINSLKIISSSN